MVLRARTAWLRRAGAFAILLAALGLGTSGALADTSSGDGRYIVTFVSGTSDAQQAADIAAAGASDVSAIPGLRMHVVDASDAAVADLTANADVAGVDSDQVRRVQGTPSDPEYPNQWALPRIGWDQARDNFFPLGSATVAVLDTGVDATHEDLAGQLVPGASMIDGSDGTTDPNGHGTWMAGIVAAATDNGIGVAGVGYTGVHVMPVTVLGADGTGQDSDIINGVLYAADHGADVILMAFSNPGYSDALQAAIDYAWAHGAVVVAATGNGGSSEATFPAGDRGVMGVSSTDFNDALDLSSNYGADTFLAAPGAGIETTGNDGGYITISGTSAAAAEVAGAAALLRANSFDATNGVIVGRLARNADPAGTVDQTGNGRLNLDRAMGDTSTDSIEPVGSPPVGGGGPYVGPYVIGATAITLTDTTTNTTTGRSGDTVTVTGGKFDGITTHNITIKWDGSGGTTVTTCSQNSGGNITGTCQFAVPGGASEGVHTVFATDSGSPANTATAPFTVDSTQPTTASVTTPASGAAYNGSTVPATFSGIAADNSTGSGLNANSTTFTLQRGSDNFYWTGSTWQAGVFNLTTTHTATTGGTSVSWNDNVTLPTWSSQSDGTYTVQAKATDKAGNSFTGSAVTFTLDRTAPTVTVDSVSPNPTSGGTTVTWHANESGTYSVRTGSSCTAGTVLASGSYSQPNSVATGILASSLSDGSNALIVCVTDAVSNTGNAPTTVTKDSTNPITASVTTPAGGSILRAATVPASFSGSAADNSGGVGLNANSTTFTLQRGSDNFYWTGTTWQAGAFALGTSHAATTSNTAATWTSAAAMPSWASQADGTYTVQATAADKVGNSFTGTAISFTLDSTSPVTATVTAPVDGSTYNASGVPSSFSGSVADNSGGAGLNANSTTFTLQRGSDNFYWTGSTWQSGVANLATTHVVTSGGTAVSWNDNATLPTWSSQSDGTYTVRATATDKAGNTFTGAAVSFTLDRTAPTVTIDSVSPNPTNGGTTVSWHASESGAYSVRVGGTNCTDGTQVDSGSYGPPSTIYQASIPAGSLAEGSNTVRVCVTDAVSNTGSTTLTVTKDSTAPTTASVTTPANNAVFRAANVPASFSGSVADNTGGSGLNANSTTFTLQRPNGDYWTGTTWQSGVFTLGTTHTATTGNTSVTWTSAAAMPSWASQAEGTYTVRATATDKTGNTFSGTAIAFTLDNTSPTTALVTAPVDGSTYNASGVPSSFSGSVADNSGGAGLNANSTTFTLQRGSDNFYWTGSTWQSGVANLGTTHVATTSGTAATWTDNVTLPTWSSQTDGTYTVQAKATDKAGNTFTGSAVTFTLDRSAPTVTIDSVTPNPTSGGTTVTWHANENGSYSVRTGTSCTAGTVLASGSYANQPNTVSTSIAGASLAEGNNTLIVCVTDAVSNTGSTTTTVTKDSTNPVTASVTTPANNSVFRPATVPASFSGSVADNTGGSGLNANSTTFTLQRPNGDYWTGTLWQSGVFTLGTTHNATSGNTAVTWTSAAAMPSWASQPDGTYTVQATATDKVGNSFTGTAISFTLDSTNPVTASVTAPTNGATYQAGTVPTTFTGSAADNSGGAGLASNSTTFTLQRSSDGSYWNGSGWQATAANLATTHAATTSGTAATWTDNATLPIWSSEAAGTYTVQAKATDKAGNTFTGSAVTFTLLAPISPLSAGTASDTTGSSTLQITGVTAPVGRTMFVEVAANPTSSTVTVTDSAGNAYTKDVDVSNGSEVRTLLFSARVTTALPGGTITITFSSPVPTDKAASAFSFEGIATPSPKDKSSTATGSGTSLSTGTTATTSQPDELLIGAFGHGDGRAAFDAGTNYTALTLAGANGAGGATIFPEYRVVSATGAYSASATNNNNKPAGWAAALVTYRIAAPAVQSITRDNASPTNAGSVDFDLTFNQSVTGVDASDFALAASGVSGASITGVSGSGTTWTVSVNTGSGSGTLGLNVVDDDSITNLNLVPLGGTGTGNGNFTGPLYTLDRSAPTVSSIVRADGNPTNANTVHWTVTFSEPVSGVDSTDFALANTGLTGPSITGVTGSGSTYTVTASTGTGNGTLGLNLVDDDSITDAVGNKLGGTGTGNGNFTGEVYTVQHNQAPSTTTPTFSPASPKTADTLTASTTTSDPDGDNVSVAWTWKVTRGPNTCTISTDSSAAAAAGTRSVTLNLGQSYTTSNCTGGSPPSSIDPSKGDSVTVEATPNDGTVNGTLKSNSVTVANTAPGASVALNDHSPKTNDILTATATRADIDGDAVSLTYVWKVNGNTKRTVTKSTGTGGDLTDSFDLGASGNGSKGDTVRVEVTPNDGSLDGTVASDQATVANSAPSLTSPSFSPATPKTDDTLTASTTTSDPDGDQVSVAWTWKVDRGGDVCTVQTSSSALAAPGTRSDSLDLNHDYHPTSCTGATIDPLNPRRGDTVSVSATPTDDDSSPASGSTQTSSVSVVNSAPTTGSVAISPHSPASDATLTANVSGFADADGDSLVYHYQWYKNNNPLAGETGSTLNLATAGNGDRGDSIKVVVYATDGNGGTSGNANDTVTVADSAPTATVSLSDHSPKTNDTLTATATKSDLDGDAVTLTYVWKVDGTTEQTTVTTGLTDTFNLSLANHGDKSQTVTVEVTPNDGTLDGSMVSDSATIVNSAPTVSLDGANSLTASEGQTKTYVFTAADADGDTLSFAAGYPTCGAHGSLVGSPPVGDGSFQCTFPDGPNSSIVAVKVKDSDNALSGESTQTVTISNVAPTVTFTTAPASANEGQTKHYVYSISDPGQDTVNSVTTSCGANGTKSNATNTDTSGSFDCTFPDGPASSTVSAQATDSDGDSGNTATQSVTVYNVAPTTTFTTAPDSANEGETKHYVYSISDPGQDTVSSVATSCGANGTKSNASNTNSGGSFDCTFPNGPATSTVSAQATDSDSDAGNTATQIVTIANLGPTVAFTAAPASANEGQTKHYTYSISDPGNDTVASVATSCGANGNKSNATNDNTSGSFDCTFPDGPAGSTVTVQATDSDGDAGNTASQGVTIANVAPTVAFTAAPASANEGQTKHYTYSISDPGQDTVSSVATSCGANGTESNATNDNTSGSFDCTFPDGPASSTVSAQATDSDNDAGNTATQGVTVYNVAPTVAFTSAPASANEGQTKHYSYSISDPGNDTVASVATSCGANGNKSNATNDNTSGSFDCTFPDGPANSTVSAQATDSDNAAGNTASQDVAIANVAPTVAFTTAPASADEGQTKHYVYSISDPGNDTVASVATSCGANGNKSNASNDNTSGSFDCTFPDGPASSTVTAQATDSDNAAGNTASQAVTIANVAPTVAFTSAPSSANEGDTKHYSYSISDPGNDTVSSVSTSCGTNGTEANATNDNTSGSFDCTFPDGPASSTVSAQATDSDGAAGNTATQSVTIANVAPTVAFTSGPTSVNEGQTVTYTYAISDPGNDTVSSVATSCGANGTKSNATNTDTSGSFDCTFPDGPASSTVSAQATDSDGAAGNTATVAVSVANVAPTVSFTSAPSSANEGETKHYAYSISDPGNDTVASVATSCGANGTRSNATNTNTSGSFDCTFPDGPASSTVSAQATDSDNDAGNTATQGVSIANVAPTVTFTSAPSSANEGDTKHYSYSISDPGQDTVSSVATSCGANGTKSNATNNDTGGSFDCTFPDGPASSTVSAQATDSDGAAGNTATQSVSIANVAPTVTFYASNDTSVSEGSTQHTYIYTIFDPGQDTITAVSTSCDSPHGVKVAASDSNTDTGGSFRCTFPDGPDTALLSAAATDSDGATGSAGTQSVTVNNVAPTVAFTSAPAAADEGQTKHYTYSISDPGNDTVSSVATSCGANGTKSNASNDNTSGSFDCTFPDGPAGSTVTAQATDSDGAAGNTASQGVVIANVPPTGTLGNNGPVSEASAATVSFSGQSDPSGPDTTAGFHYAFACDNSSLAGATYAGSGTSASTSCTYDDGPSDHTVRARIIDKDGGYTEYTTVVHVNNVVPTGTLGNNGPVSEGSAATVSFSGQSDPSSADTAAGFHYAFSCSNGDLSGATYGSSGTSASAPCTYDDGPSDHTVKARIIDKDGGYSEYTTSVHVNNVPPTAIFTNDGPVAEGSSFHLYLSSPSDPSSTDTTAGFQYAFDCGDGSGFGAYSASSSATCSTTDNGTRTVKGRIKDKDGGYTEYTASVSVSNAPPVVTAPADQSSNEGQNKSFALGSFTDPGSEGTDGWTVDVNWGDGTAHTSFHVSSTGTIPSAAHTYADNSLNTVTVKVTDKDGGFDSKTFSVSVANVPPTVTAPADQSSNEGQNKAFDLGSFSDPGVLDGGVSGWSVDVNWGDGSAHTMFTQALQGSLGTRSHTYLDNASYLVTVTVTDKDGGSDSKSFNVSVANVPPTVTAPAAQSSNEGENHSFSLGSFTDPGTEGINGWTIDVNWGDGGTDEFQVSGPGTIPARSHTYADNASYTVTVQVTDKDGGSDSKTFSATVNNVNPTATFGNDGPANEGSSFHLSLSNPYDPGSADTAAGFTYAFDCGSGLGAYGTSPVATCTTDDNGLRSVKGRIKDKDGGYTEYTATVTVNNVAPSATFSSDGPVNEGTSFHLSLTNPSDPSGADTAAGFQYAFDCGSGYGAYGSSASATCSTTDSGLLTVHGKIKDKDGGERSYSDTVTVNNVPPTATLSNNGAVNEGSPATITFSGQSDPSSADTAAGFHYAYACDNGSLSSATYGNSGTAATKSCTFDDGPGTYTVRARIIDKDNGYTEYQTNVAVNNVAPTGTFSGPATGVWGTAYTFNWPTQSDPSNADTAAGFHYAFSCTNGDLSGATYGNSGSSASTQCSYPTPGTYTVRSRIIDKDGGSTERTASITIGKRTTTLTYLGDTSGQYSDRPSLSARLRDQNGDPVPNRTITFTLGSQTATATTNANGDATSSAIQLGQPASTTVNAAFNAASDSLYTGSTSPNVTFTINKEDAALDYSGDNIGLTGVNATLRATVWDSAAAGYPGGGNDTTIGDITKMWVRFTVYTETSCGSGTASATLWAQVSDTGNSGDGIGTATAAWGPGNSEATYCVIAKLVYGNGSSNDNAWYQGDPTAPSALTIYSNTGQFVTGGGWVQDAVSSNGKGNFGFNARFNNNNKPQGQLVYVYRGTYNGVEADFVIKSNALNSLGFQCWNGSAYGTCPMGNNTYPALSTLQGKATIQINRTSDGTSLYSDGSATFNASVLDSGQSSGIDSDRFTIRVWDKNGVLYRQIGNLDGPPPYYGMVFLKGGNVVIHPSR